MSGVNENKKYEAFKIPDRRQGGDDWVRQALAQAEAAELPAKREDEVSFSGGAFYEIEYDACPIPGGSKHMMEPQPVKEPAYDAVRDLFGQMRDIARAHRSTYDFSRFFDRRIQSDNAAIFYEQGMFMKDFTDEYADSVPFSRYFPCYQMMGYQQLRTYFTWRSAVRKGNVADTSLSYAFLYIYELLNNIGVSHPEDGLDRLMCFWTAFRVYNKTVDKYVLRWLKDYHIYYQLPLSFRAFVRQNNLAEHYPSMAGSDDAFDLFCAISKYDIRKSVFFTDSNAKIIRDCFDYVLSKLRQVFAENSLSFDEAIFHPTKKMSVWMPFKDALFHQGAKQADRRVVLTQNEIYICKQGKWAFNTTITAESGRQLIGYVMKQMESVLRKLMKCRFKLSADYSVVTHDAVRKLSEAGLSLEKIVSSATEAFYREATRTVVKVDHEALSIIRQEALSTREKLIVPENEEQIPVLFSPGSLINPPEAAPPAREDENEPDYAPDPWAELKSALTPTEIEALSVVLKGGMDIKKFADECGVMLEVLLDGINEKAMDFVGDNLMDEAFELYDDYKENVKEWLA